MVQEQEQNVMKIRYWAEKNKYLTYLVWHRDDTGQSTKFIAREWGYEEENAEIQFDDGSQSWEDEDVS